MRVIPVLDLMDGFVVRARAGDRANYRPIETPLSASADPVAVLAGLLTLNAFPVVYIADLDGILKRPRNDAALDRLTAAYPDISFWVDNGIHEDASARKWLALRPCRLIFGTESFPDPELFSDLGDRAILSIDFRGDDYLGNPGLLAHPDRWPDDIIVMTLARVGSDSGPDLARLTDFRARAPTRCRLYAAGGVRNDADLAQLATAGISGALVATALHAGRITSFSL